MIRNGMLHIALGGVLLLAACQNTGEAETDSIAKTEEETVENADDNVDERQGSEAEEVHDEESAAAEQGDEQAEVSFQYEVNPNTYAVEPIEGSDASSQVALLTYDDAPDGNAVEIAETLAEKDAPAIFFVNGMYLESEEGRDALRTIHDMGFEIGNHTYTHPSLPDIAPEQQHDEIVDTSNLVEEITGERPRFFRAPFGLNTADSERVAAESGMTLMNWTYGYDWEPQYQESSALADIMVNTEFLNHGANLLMHDREWTRDATEDIVDGLREKGYDMVDPKEIASSSEEEVTE